MVTIIKEIINTTYDKLTFIGGLLLVMVSVFCSREVAIWNIKLPEIDRAGRGISGVVGILLLLISLFVWFSTERVGLFSTPPNPTVGTRSDTFLLINNAYAKEGKQYTIKQYRPLRVDIASEGTIGLYADNIRLRKPSRLVLFKAESLNSLWNEKIRYDELINKLESESVLFEKFTTKRETYDFLFGNKKYSLQVKEIYWYLFGADYMVVEIKNQHKIKH